MQHTNDSKNEVVVHIPRTPLRFLWYVSRAHMRYLIGALLAITGAEFIATSTPYIFKSIIDTAQNAAGGVGAQSGMWLWVGLYLCATAVMFFLWRVSGFIGLELATRANATAYNTLFTHLSEHSHTYFADRFAGSLSSKVAHASEGSQSLVEAFVWNYYTTLLSVLFTFGYLVYSSVIAALLFLLLVSIMVPFNVYLARRRRPHVVEYAAQATKARGYAVDALTNMAAIRQFVRARDENERFGEHIAKMRMLNIRQWRISEWGLLLNNIIIVLFEALILFVAVRMWMQGTLTTGELVMVTTLLMFMQRTLTFIGSSMNGFIRRYGEIQEGLHDILLEHEIVDARDAAPLRVSAGDIEWQGVTFSYGENAVFTDFSLKIRRGERIGLVGASGAGKTTFVSLLLRQHEVNGGCIRIDEQDIAHVTQDSLREHITIVPQEPMLFHRSIHENIAYGKPGATREEVESAARKAHAHEFVVTLADGYDTLVGERGVKLSGGQKQRIAIARAMLKDAPILILDEATSALDSESEVAIQKALHELMVEKTVIAIAHRLSTLREMDRIIVLENGKIIEDGTHAALVKMGGVYARLWQHQAGGFLQE